MYYVTFEKRGRTGNTLFQYLYSKLISVDFGHKLIPIEEIVERTNFIIVSDDNAADILSGKMDIKDKNVICDGYFQNSNYYVPRRNQILDLLYNNNTDSWINCYGDKQYLTDFINSTHKYNIKENDVVLAVRLDDFIERTSPTSNIVPPNYYLNILNNLNVGKLYIVCDKIRQDWEFVYLKFFDKWNPILIQEDLIHDCALFRDCSILLQSNSTLCWFMSFISKTKTKRYICRTNFYKAQILDKIEDNDIVTFIPPLLHKDVYGLHKYDLKDRKIYPFPYCIPDDYVVDETVLNNKTIQMAPLVPGEVSTYKFGVHQEKEYNEMYQQSLFAITMKKGGWDCLRHYEILANGCIPVFKDIQNCPKTSLVSFPKDLIIDANEKLLPWNVNNKPLYDNYVKQLLNHTKKYCSSSASVEYLLNKININPNNVLLITGDVGVNYTREMFWIGMKRHIQNLGGIAVEYPKIKYLYDNYDGDKSKLHGNGFIYTSKLKDDYTFTFLEIMEKIKIHFFDLIVYGKVGPDEGYQGSHPNMPLWETVNKSYKKDEIVYLYGGDECINLLSDNKYSQHILYHSQFANCFVRELII